jgi:hypothetical protein
MTPARKIADEEHAKRMHERMIKRSTLRAAWLRAPRRPPIVDHVAVFRADGFDAERLDAATRKRERRAAR